MMIPYLDLNRVNDSAKAQIRDALQRVLDSGWYILGKEVAEFEQRYAQFNGVKHCVGLANGLDALILSLRALDVGPGDEVIVPSNTYIATWLAVSYVGATPIPVEPRTDTCNINPELIAERINDRTKAILPVNLYGQAAELEAICEIAKQYKLYVVEDNAQAQGAIFKGVKTGAWGDVNATSFYPGKNLGALGDGGAITTNDPAIEQRIRILRNYGSQKKYYNDELGVNSRLDEIHAAVLNIKLEILDDQNTERQRLAAIYHKELNGIGDLTLPVIHPDANSVHHIFMVRTAARDALQKHLHEEGINTLIHYPVPPHLQKAYAPLGFEKGAFPIAEEIAYSALSIPLFPGLTESEQAHIIQCIKHFF